MWHFDYDRSWHFLQRLLVCVSVHLPTVKHPGTRSCVCLRNAMQNILPKGFQNFSFENQVSSSVHPIFYWDGGGEAGRCFSFEELNRFINQGQLEIFHDRNRSRMAQGKKKKIALRRVESRKDWSGGAFQAFWLWPKWRKTIYITMQYLHCLQCL